MSDGDGPARRDLLDSLTESMPQGDAPADADVPEDLQGRHDLARSIVGAIEEAGVEVVSHGSQAGTHADTFELTIELREPDGE